MWGITHGGVPEETLVTVAFDEKFSSSSSSNLVVCGGTGDCWAAQIFLFVGRVLDNVAAMRPTDRHLGSKTNRFRMRIYVVTVCGR